MVEKAMRAKANPTNPGSFTNGVSHVMFLQDELGELLTSLTGNGQFSGVVSIRQGDQVLFEEAYGYADRSWKVRNTLNTRFRIASVSKLFTAVSILKLVDAGQLTLDEEIVRFLGLANTKIPEGVAVYHALTMTSGIADWFDEKEDTEEDWERMWQERPIYSVRKIEDYLPLFAYDAPISKVGKRYHYCGAGYMLLGLIIERVSGLSYFDYVRQHIFSKIGMTDSDFLSLDGVYNRVAEGYHPELRLIGVEKEKGRP